MRMENTNWPCIGKKVAEEICGKRAILSLNLNVDNDAVQHVGRCRKG